MPSRPGAVPLFLVVLVVATGLTAASTTEIRIADSTDVPEQTTTYRGTEYTADAVRTADPGETISFSVATTVDDSYFVDVRNADDQIVDSKEGEGDQSFELTLDDYPAGTYVLVVDIDGRIADVHPLVVRGYEVSVDHPSQADEELDATVSTTYRRGNRSDDVEVVVGDDDEIVRADASLETPGTYEATVPVDSLSGGTYSVHATVRGDDQAFGEKELIGLSPSSTVEIEGDGGGGGGSTGGSGGGGGGGVGGTGSTGGTATATNGTATGSPSTATDDGDSTATDGGESDGEATDDGVITPSSGTTTGATTTVAMTRTPATAGTDEASGGLSPGFGVGAVLAAALAAGVGLLARRRR